MRTLQSPTECSSRGLSTQRQVRGSGRGTRCVSIKGVASCSTAAHPVQGPVRVRICCRVLSASRSSNGRHVATQVAAHGSCKFAAGTRWGAPYSIYAQSAPLHTVERNSVCVRSPRHRDRADFSEHPVRCSQGASAACTAQASPQQRCGLRPAACSAERNRYCTSLFSYCIPNPT